MGPWPIDCVSPHRMVHLNINNLRLVLRWNVMESFLIQIRSWYARSLISLIDCEMAPAFIRLMFNTSCNRYSTLWLAFVLLNQCGVQGPKGRVSMFLCFGNLTNSCLFLSWLECHNKWYRKLLQSALETPDLQFINNCGSVCVCVCSIHKINTDSTTVWFHPTAV